MPLPPPPETVVQLKFPSPSVDNTCPVVPPLIFNVLIFNVPTLVMLGCAALVTEYARFAKAAFLNSVPAPANIMLPTLPKFVFCVVGTPVMLTTGSTVVVVKFAPMSTSCVILICVVIFYILNSYAIVIVFHAEPL